VRERECFSRKNSLDSRSIVFVNTAQHRIASREIGHAYGRCVSVHTQAVWRWDSDPFGTSLGNSQPTENPQLISGTATVQQAAAFRQNLRFPGQLADGESSKYQNGFRIYDTLGRYTQSDPIGLYGGISTFGYGLLNPVKLLDKNGTRPISPVDPGGPGWPTFPGYENPNPGCGFFSKGRGECLAMCMLEATPACAAIGAGSGTIVAAYYAGAAACFAPPLALPTFVIVEVGVGVSASLACGSLMRAKCLRQCPDRCGEK
jgi:RHS repeat-associated protein